MRHSNAEYGRLLDPRLVWANDKAVDPTWNSGSSYRLMEAVWQVRAGQAWIGSAGGMQRAKPGDWVFMRACRRSQRFQAGTRIWSVGLSSHRSGRTSWYAGPDVLILPSCPELERRTRRLLKVVARVSGNTDASDGKISTISATLPGWLLLDAAFRLWLGTVIIILRRSGVQLGTSQGGDPRLEKAMAIIRRDPWGADSRPAALAAQVGLSRRRLEQLCSAALRHGLGDERSQRRVTLAVKVLADSTVSVKEAAARCGFVSGTAFSTWFRRHAGRSPSVHRRGQVI